MLCYEGEILSDLELGGSSFDTLTLDGQGGVAQDGAGFDHNHTHAMEGAHGGLGEWFDAGGIAIAG